MTTELEKKCKCSCQCYKKDSPMHSCAEIGGGSMYACINLSSRISGQLAYGKLNISPGIIQCASHLHTSHFHLWC